MSSARFRILRAALLLPLPLIVLLALSRSAPRAPVSAPSAPPPPEPTRLAPAYADTFAFFSTHPAPPPSGPGLFATNHFVPPPPPPPAPPPPPTPPPPPAQTTATYRGFASFSNHTALAYLAVGERILALPAEAAVAEGWRLLRFDADAAELARGEERLRLPFRQPVALPAPASP